MASQNLTMSRRGLSDIGNTVGGIGNISNPMWGPAPSVGPGINPTVKKATIYDGRTGNMIQQAGNFTPEEIEAGSGTFPGGLQMQAGSGTVGGYGGHRGRHGMGYSGHSGAIPERFGNPGGVMAPASPNALQANGRAGIGSLDNFYSARTENPFTKLAVNPMANDIMKQRAAMQGFGGTGDVSRNAKTGSLQFANPNQADPQKLAMNDLYNNARSLGNREGMYGGLTGLMDIQSQRDAVAQAAKRAQETAIQNNRSAAGGMAASSALSAFNPLLGSIASAIPRADGGPVEPTNQLDPWMLENPYYGPRQWGLPAPSYHASPRRSMLKTQEKLGESASFLGVPMSIPAYNYTERGLFGYEQPRINMYSLPSTQGARDRNGNKEPTLPFNASEAYSYPEAIVDAIHQQKKMEQDIAGISERRRPSLFARADGGKTGTVNPYLVGEEGIEIYKPKNGPPELIGSSGPEIRTFSQKGEIIPNHEIKPMADGGLVSNITNNFKRNFGQSRLGREFGLQNWADESPPEVEEAVEPSPLAEGYKKMFSSRGPYDNLQDSSTYGLAPDFIGAGRNLIDMFARHQMKQLGAESPPPEVEAPQIPAPTNPYLRSRSYDPMSAIPQFFGPYTPEGAPIHSLHGEVARKAALAKAVEAQRNEVNVGLADTTNQAMTSIPDVRRLSTNPLLPERSFLTPYGTASVTYGQPKKEAIIEGLPASEYFQRAANRQGSNRYANPEADYHPEKLVLQKAANDRAMKLGNPLRSI